jgi:hypothetical protein
MMLHNRHDPSTATGRLFSRMMVTIVVLMTLALVTFGPQSMTQEVFSGRTPSTALVPAE